MMTDRCSRLLVYSGAKWREVESAVAPACRAEALNLSDESAWELICRGDMYRYGTWGAGLSVVALLVSHRMEGALAESPSDAKRMVEYHTGTLDIRFDNPASIPGGQNPHHIELFLDGRPCMEITPSGETCVLRAPPEAVCDLWPPLAMGVNRCLMGTDGSWNAYFRLPSDRVIADDRPHTLTALISTPEGVSVREAPVVVRRAHADPSAKFDIHFVGDVKLL
ncbi:hypothetical protein [Polyangium sp. 15x6]|uniref:hypothetical protein n=1 Tax=Polyangium sp. 15x6 TaxID=3042687 RepID=UPI00249A606F|nr:hypothetical protein [Polyangium sp. 15x6]MDI3288162.1 hypothetical protein [Polyangium sp. 15x6]